MCGGSPGENINRNWDLQRATLRLYFFAHLSFFTLDKVVSFKDEHKDVDAAGSVCFYMCTCCSGEDLGLDVVYTL